MSSRYNPRAQARAQQLNTYSPIQLVQFLRAAAAPSDLALLAATDYITTILGSNRIPCVVMGGFSPRLRGDARSTQDVDIAVDSNMSGLLRVISSHLRIYRPAGPVSSVIKTFIKVGGQYNPGQPEKLVEVDLILRGSLGAPDNLEMASEMVTITVSSMQKQFALLDIRGIVTAKVGAFCARHSEKDYSDLEFLGQAFPVGVQQRETRDHPVLAVLGI